MQTVHMIGGIHNYLLGIPCANCYLSTFVCIIPNSWILQGPFYFLDIIYKETEIQGC